MRNFKQAVVSTVLVISIITIFPLLLSSFIFREDIAVREELAGSIDYVVIGASQARCAFVPAVLDEKLGCTSYNLSVDSMTTADRLILLNKEINRNPVKTVVLEISHDALQRSNKNNAADGNFHMLNRLDTFTEKANYLIERVPFDNWLYIYARNFCESVANALNASNNDSLDDNKGFNPTESRDYSLDESEISINKHNRAVFPQNFDNETVADINEIIEMCHSKNIRVIIAVVPVADSNIWKFDGLDNFYVWLRNYCSEKKVEFYDFNLAKSRYELFSDDISYGSSPTHMSEAGAYAFTELYTDILNKVDNGISVDNYFFESYSEMTSFSPYAD